MIQRQVNTSIVARSTREPACAHLSAKVRTTLVAAVATALFTFDAYSRANAQDAAAAAPVTTQPPAAVRSAGPWPGRVSATYRVAFNGFDIGEFKFAATVTGQTYSLTGNAELSALLGAFSWSSQTRASGTVAGDVARPAGYTFDYRTTQKSGSVKLGFSDGRIAGVSMVPPSPASSGSVPVRDFHLKDVLDPLTAVMALSRGKANPCGKKLSIFDGKQRFDLALSFKKQVRITEARPSGQPTLGYVCRVRYIPIAGHKNNDQTQQMAANGGIEVVLRPIPSANLVVPYEITLPTAGGTAVLTSTRVEIVTPGQRQIALVH